jgi:hypothetical protein
MKRSVLGVLMAAVACVQEPALRPIVPRLTIEVAEVDGGAPDAGASDAGNPSAFVCALPFGGPDCCGASGARVGSASCSDAGYRCQMGSACTCLGTVAPFHCVDSCAGDAYVGAVCGPSGWGCPQGLIKTSECAEGTCFGEPGDCCVGARCVSGEWTCRSIRSPCP